MLSVGCYMHIKPGIILEKNNINNNNNNNNNTMIGLGSLKS
jgi:hypothetical protein